MNANGGTDQNARQQQYLDAMGILRWQLKDRDLSPDTAVEQAEGELPSDEVTSTQVSSDQVGVKGDAVADVVVEPGAVVDQRSDVATSTWDALQSRVSHCTACDLHTSRTQTVFGVGDHNADWLVIGEAPGADEDAQGEPFVGRAGQLLNAMLLACGLKREQVYIANILKCRPPDNRDPRPEEVVSCESFLMRQIQLIQPKLILAVGRIAAQNLLQCDTPIGKLRGKVHQFRDTGIPLIATYHPAYLLRSPAEKRKAWQDLQLAMRTTREGNS